MGYEEHELTLVEIEERLEHLAKGSSDLQFLATQLLVFIGNHPEYADST